MFRRLLYLLVNFVHQYEELTKVRSSDLSRPPVTMWQGVAVNELFICSRSFKGLDAVAARADGPFRWPSDRWRRVNDETGCRCGHDVTVSAEIFIER